MARLLLVDDDPTQVKLWRAILEASGHSIATADSVPQAVRMLPDLEPDVLLMDLRLPELQDGLLLIRKADEREATKIVVLSGWPRDLENLPEQKLVDRVLAKPVRPPTLLRVITELVT